MPADKPTELSRIKLKNLNSTARPYDQRAFSPLDPTVSWLSHLALAIYMFVVVNFDALAQGMPADKTYIHTYIHTYIQACMHACMHACIHTYIHTYTHMWAQVEWWLEHRHGWLVKPQWAGSVLGRVTRYEYQVLGSTSIPARLDTLVYWEPFSWLTSVGTTRNTVIRLGWSRIGLAVLNLYAAGVGLIGRPAVISGRYNKCHSLQLQNHYAHFPPLHHTHIHAKHNRAEPVMGNGYGFRGIVCWPWQEKSCVIG